MTIQHLRSSTANKRPTPAAMSDGQLAVNTNTASPGLFFKDSAGALIKVGPVHVGTTAPNASPAGGGETGNTVGEQWLDTTGGTYVFKVWDGSAWRSESGTFVDVNGDVMTGALGIIAGSAGSPGLYFSGDTNTGLYSPGADQVAISTGGSGRLFVDASGNVGVGTSTPNTVGYGGTVFGLYGAANNGGNIWLTSEATTAGNRTGRIGFGTEGNTSNKETARIWSLIEGSTAGNIGGNLVFNTKADGAGLTERLRITSAGLVGVGTSSPATALDVNGTITARGSLIFKDANNSNTYGLRALSGIIVADTGTNYPTGWNFQYGNTASSALYIDSSGRVGVGTTSPSANLHVSASSGTAIKITETNNGVTGALQATSTGPALGSDTNHPLVFYTNAVERLRIDSSGRLGIGTSTPGSILHLQQSASAAVGPDLRLVNNAGTASDKSRISFYGGTSPTVRAAYDFNINTSGVGEFIWSNGEGSLTERMRLDASGRLGIGNTTAGSYNAGFNQLVVGSSGDQGVTIVSGTSNSGTLAFADGTSGADAYRGYVQYQHGSTNALVFATDGSERFRCDSSGRLLVGTSSALTNVLIKGDLGSSAATTPQQQFALATNSYNAGLSVTNYSASGYGGVLSLNSSKSNTLGTNALVDNTIAVGTISFNGNDGTNFVPCAEIKAAVDGTPGANDMPGRLVFSVTADGASSPTERMRISTDGLTRTYGDGDSIIAATGQAAGTTFGVFVGRHSATSTTTGTNSFIVYTNGNVVNTNNSYGAISDIKLKENIVDATPQWNDIKALQVRKYNFKEGQTHTQIGLVAQEVELVSPGLVSESPDRDEDGNDLGTVTKSVNYSVLYMKAVKALQEAMERIETLEAKVAALETK